MAVLALADEVHRVISTAVDGSFYRAVNPDLAAAQAKNQVVVTADPKECSFQFNPTGTSKFTSSCDIAKQVLSASSVSYENVAGPAGAPATIKIGEQVITSYNAAGLPASGQRRCW